VKLRSPRLWIGVLSLLGVVYLVAGDTFRTSPGPLATVHGREPELSGFRSCSQCHGGWFQSMSEACLRCHEATGKQIAAGTGLHGSLGKERAEHCAPCHSEHHGADFAVVNAQSFAQAGVPDPQAFGHERVGFAMAGKHLELECTKCHKHADAPVLAKGEHRFAGLDRDCHSCHEDAHEGRMKLACAKCHGQTDFKVLNTVGHDEFLPLVGGHGDVGCRECHGEQSPHSFERLGRGGKLGPRECVDCHESPHMGEFVGGIARAAMVKGGKSCVLCHLPEHTSFRQEGVTVTPDQHAASGFALDRPHDQAACAACHPADGADFRARYPGRAGDDCAKCHEDVHRGQFDDGPFAAYGCLGCHDRLHFSPHEFTPEKHAETAMALDGRHLEVECRACHADPVEGEPRAFAGTASDCDSCHEDAHDGYFARFRQELALVDHGTCARCHLTAGFSQLEPTGFDHEAFTGFAIRGAHAQSKCESCHARADVADETGRTFGTVEARYGEFEGCVTCHEDPHEGEFDRHGLPHETEVGAGCARCHVETSFRAFPNGFAHRRWTGFALEGAHAEASCEACHPPLEKASYLGRTWARARGKACSSCHEDPHAGQFEMNHRVDCGRCHQTTSFRDLSFNHDIHSRFRLDKPHKGLACASCHKPFKQGDRDVIRYRPLAMDCAACHAAPEKPFSRGKGRRR